MALGTNDLKHFKTKNWKAITNIPVIIQQQQSQDNNMKNKTIEASIVVTIETDANLNKSKNNKSEISEKDLLRSFDSTSVALFASTNLRKTVLKSFLKNEIAMGSVQILLNGIFLENSEHALLKINNFSYNISIKVL